MPLGSAPFVETPGIMPAGGGITVPFTCMVVTLCTDAVWIAAEGRIEGDGLSSLLTGADTDNVGESTDPDMLRPLSRWTRLGGPVDGPANAVPRTVMPFCGIFVEILVIGLGVWIGASAELSLTPIRNIILGAGSGAETFNLSLGCGGSGTAFFAAARRLLKKIFTLSQCEDRNAERSDIPQVLWQGLR